MAAALPAPTDDPTRAQTPCSPSLALGTDRGGAPHPRGSRHPAGSPPSPPQGRAERPLPGRGPHCSRDPFGASALCVFLPCCGVAASRSDLSSVLLNFNTSYKIKLRYRKRRGTGERRARGPAGQACRSGGCARWQGVAGRGLGSVQVVAVDPTTTE